ncbi:hypothetical protein TNCV_2217331 [Trichonephila clavipes]|nr:hypothetical protein TNCV_2217331 [Trichonephila clavipes]
MSRRAGKATAAVPRYRRINCADAKTMAGSSTGVISDLIESMPRRISACIAARDNLAALHFKYDQARRRFVEWAQNEIAVVPNFHKRILFSDEAHFWLNGYVNKQNCRIWSEANPQVYVETPLLPEKTDCLGYVKSLVYAKPQTLDHLEDNIRRIIADIRPLMLEKVIETRMSRLDYIRASRGSPMPEIIFKM